MTFQLHGTLPRLSLASDIKMSRSKTLATQVARVVRIIGRKAFL